MLSIYEWIPAVYIWVNTCWLYMSEYLLTIYGWLFVDYIGYYPLSVYGLYFGWLPVVYKLMNACCLYMSKNLICEFNKKKVIVLQWKMHLLFVFNNGKIINAPLYYAVIKYKKI